MRTLKRSSVLGLLVAGEGIVVATTHCRVVSHEVEDVLALPHRSERFRNVEVAETDGLVSGNIELQVVARRKGNLLAVFGSKNKFFNEGGDVAIADDSELVGLLGAGAGAAGFGDIDP